MILAWEKGERREEQSRNQSDGCYFRGHSANSSCRRGYYAFEAVPPAKIAMPDFFARLNGKKARIEVKHLNEPDDWITQIARNRWRLSSNARPEKYGFRTQLRHNHRGPVSEKAINRIKSIIDQLPDMNSPHEETLDGDIYVKLEKLPLQPGQTLGDLFVTIGITAENVMIDSANVVFLKASG